MRALSLVSERIANRASISMSQLRELRDLRGRVNVAIAALEEGRSDTDEAIEDLRDVASTLGRFFGALRVR